MSVLGSAAGDGSVTTARLRAWVAEDFGVELLSLDRVRLGADAAAELWRATSIEGLEYAVKLSGAATPAALQVTAHLAWEGVRGVASPMVTRLGEVCTRHDGRLLSVVPWLSGSRALDGGMSERHWTSYGVLLAQVHEATVTDVLLDLLPREEHTHDGVASLVRHVSEQLAAFGRGTVIGDRLTAVLAADWNVALSRIERVLEAADLLGAEVVAGSQPDSVLCHGDPHLGNLLLGEEGHVWLVDWDDALLAPRERDLIFLLGGVLAFAPVTAEQQQWFFAGYGRVDVDLVRVAYYQCTRALVDLGDPALAVLEVAWRSPEERESALGIVQGILSATGLVDGALASLQALGR